MKCHIAWCNEEHPIPKKYCYWCFTDHSGNYSQHTVRGIKGKKYATWHYDKNMNRHCHRCYMRQLIRRKKAGLPIAITPYRERMDNMRHNKKELDEKKIIAAYVNV